MRNAKTVVKDPPVHGVSFP